MWAGLHNYDLQNCYCLFRSTFDLPAQPASAPLYLTADQSYQLWINEQFVCRGPARGFQDSWPFDEVDVAPFLRAGENVIAVRAYHPGCGSFSYISRQAAGVLVAARWQMEDQTFEINSDESWKTRRQIGVKKETLPSSIQLLPQEHIDLRLEPRGWQSADFDHSDWQTPRLSRAWNSPPWNALESRGIPMLREEFAPAPRWLGESSGLAAREFCDVREVVALAVSEGLQHQARDEDFKGILTVAPVDEGQYRSYLFDYGRVMVGSLQLEIAGARGGEIIDCLSCETTYEDDTGAPTQTPWLDPTTHSAIALGTRLVCRDGDNSHAFYHLVGARYLMLRVRNAPHALTIKLRLKAAGYPLETVGEFRSSNAQLEQIWRACAHTEQICSLDAYVDTPWREQAQWWGDARVQAWNTFHLADDARLLARGIRQIGAQQLPIGLTYGHAPTIAHSCVLPDFTLVWMLTQWDYYFQTGSLHAFEEQRATTARALDYFRAHTDETLDLVRSDARYWLFLDWTALPRQGFSTVLNAWLLLALERLAQMHRLNGDENAAASLESWAKRVRAALEKLIVGGLLADGYDAQGARFESFSIHAQTLGLILSLRGLDESKAVETVLLPFVEAEELPTETDAIFPSAYWVTYVLSVLTEHGKGAAVLKFIERHWVPMARYGSTWETYAQNLVAGESSHSHAWSAHPLFHLMQTIGGLTQRAPRWKKMRFAPVFVGESGGATVPTPHGAVVSNWHKQGEKIAVSLQVPTGIEVEIALPDTREMRGAGRHAWKVTASESIR